MGRIIKDYFDYKDDVLVAIAEKQLAQMENDFHQIAARNDIDEVAKLNYMATRVLCISASGKKILGYVHQARNATLHMKLMGISLLPESLQSCPK